MPDQSKNTCVVQSGATTAEIAELLQSRRYCLLARLYSERPGPELMQALREAPIDELEEHGVCLSRSTQFQIRFVYRSFSPDLNVAVWAVADFDRRRTF